MQQPLVSVIVPVYNTEAFLPKCLDSIICQTYRKLEIICINDESTDRSGEILDEYAKRDRRIKVIHTKNGGVSAARNIGLLAATGEWITGVDSDDYLEPEIYQKAVEKLTDRVDILVFGTRIVCEPGVVREISEDTYALPEEAILPPEDERRRRVNVCFWNKIWRRSLFEKYHFSFPEGLIHEDSYLYRCMAPVAGGMYILPFLGYNYVQRAGSYMDTHVSKEAWEKYQGILAIVERLLEFHISVGSISLAREYILPFWLWGLQIISAPICPPDYAASARRKNRELIHRHRLMFHLGNDLRLFLLQVEPRWKRSFIKVQHDRVLYRFFGIVLFSDVYENNLFHHRENAWLNKLRKIFRTSKV